MPVTWCYQVEGQAQPVCERGFPLGCYVTKTSKRKDTCRLNVSIDIYFIPRSEMSSDFIWDFGKLPFPSHLGKYIIKNGKISTKYMKLGK